jgi:hydroxyethylthiazole kinase-like uncharacterized protein yjeF
MFSAPRLPHPPPPPELLDNAAMARADARAGELGVAGETLMEAAGRAVARAVRRRFPPCRVVVLCGPGNNGGDGYVAARLLSEAGWPVRLAALAAARPGSDAARAERLWRGPMAPFSVATVARADLVIDAVFGAGLARPLAPEIAAVLAAAGRLVAVDVPSGLDGTLGSARGAVTPAALTVTFFRLKPGHLLLPGRSLVGEIVLADIGLPARVLADIAPSAHLNQPALWRLPHPRPEDHKYRRGVVDVLGGAMPGAALLAAAAARHVGAGLVALHAETLPAAAPFGLILRRAVRGTALPTPLADPRRRVIVAGPGLGHAEARAWVPVILACGSPVVLDADALSAFAGAPEALRGAAVLTPHGGEFARLFGTPGPDRLGAARVAARRTGAVVVLKGADTLIVAPDGRAALNASAPPALATAGAGDVLAGMIGGLIAQGMAPYEAAAAAVFVHGRAAVRAGSWLIAEDLLATLGGALREARDYAG